MLTTNRMTDDAMDQARPLQYFVTFDRSGGVPAAALLSSRTTERVATDESSDMNGNL